MTTLPIRLARMVQTTALLASLCLTTVNTALADSTQLHAHYASLVHKNQYLHRAQDTSISPKKTLVIFGDSLSDDGNTHALLNGINQGEHHSIDILMDAFTHVLRSHVTPYATLDDYLSISRGLNYAMYMMILPGVGNIPVMPKEPYWNGRFSNGKVWADYITQSPQFTGVNMAFGGSWVEAYEGTLSYDDLFITGQDKLHNLIKKLIVGKILPPSLQLEIAYYFNEHYHGNDNATYLIWAGGNDYINKPEDVDGVINSMNTALLELIKRGAKDIRVVNLPDLGQVPRFHNTALQSRMSELSSEHNKQLAQLIKTLQKSHPKLIIDIIDIHTLFQRIITDYHELGFTENYAPCGPDLMHTNDKNAFMPLGIKIPFDRALRGIAIAQMDDHYGNDICDDPNAHIFWDDIHPTTRVHAMIAQEIAHRLMSRSNKVIL